MDLRIKNARQLNVWHFKLVPPAGLEPARFWRGILSALCLPISPRWHFKFGGYGGSRTPTPFGG